MKLLTLLIALVSLNTSFAQTFSASTTETFKNDHHTNLAILSNGFIGMHLSDNKWQMRNFRIAKERYGLSLIRYDEEMNTLKKFQLPGVVVIRPIRSKIPVHQRPPVSFLLPVP
jgi:hypothetical protein